MTEIVGCSFEGIRGAIAPGSSGLGDGPITRLKTVGAAGAAANIGSRISGYARDHSNEFDTWLACEDYMLVGQSQFWRARMDFVFSDTDGSIRNPIDPDDLPLTKYSMRFYFKMDSLSNILSAPFNTLFSFLDGDGDTSSSNYSWTYGMRGFNTVTPFDNHRLSIRNGRNSLGTGSAEVSGTNSAAWASTIPFRAEIQVDGSRSGNTVFVRLYQPDGTTCFPLRSLGAKPTKITADRIYIGDNETTTPIQTGPLIGPITICDTFDLDGAFHFDESASDAQLVSTSAVGAPLRRKVYEWFEWDGVELVEVNYLGVWDGDSIVDEQVTEMLVRDIVPPPYTAYHWFQGEELEDSDPLFYFSTPDPEQELREEFIADAIAAGNSPAEAEALANAAFGPREEEGNWAFPLGLIYPSGPAPAGGWPIFVWFHGGFFIGGTNRRMPRPLINYLLSRGFAVATVGYRKSAVVFQGSTYPSYPDAGVYPSWIIDGKNAINWLKARAEAGTGEYPINGDKVVVGGHSAGGFIAHGIAFSQDLVDSARSMSFRAKDNGVWQTVPGADDPDVLAAISWAGPVDLQWACDNDLTHPNYGSPSFIDTTDLTTIATSIQASTNGIIVATGKAITGRNLGETLPDISHISLAHLIDLNAARLPPRIAYARGTSDFLIPAQHPVILEAALDDVGYEGEYTYMEEPGITHDVMEYAYNAGSLDRWFESIPGL